MDVYNNKYSSRLFVILSIVFLLLTGLTLFFIGDVTKSESYLLKVFTGIVQTVFATALVGFVGGIFIYFITPKTNRFYYLKIITPDKITKELQSMRQETNSWRYAGGFGRHFRGVTMPELYKSAKSSNKAIRVEGIIISPEDNNLCKLHATMRNSLNGVENKDSWRLEEVRKELLVTLLKCQDHFKSNHLIELKVFICNFASFDRYDIADNKGLLTREDRVSPAILWPKESKLYDNAIQNYIVIKNQSTEVNLKSHYAHNNISSLNIDIIKKRLNEMGLSIKLSDVELENLLTSYKINSNPYK